MSWWGTLIGGTLGFILGGPLGALLGGALGSFSGGARSFNAGTGADNGVEQAQMAFFAATFSVMGHVAKADGRVSREEIRLANRVMDQFGLNAAQRDAAQNLFNEGKERGFPLDDVVDQLRAECGRAVNLLRMFVEVQFQAALADGGIDVQERRVLQRVAARLGLSAADFDAIERMVRSGASAGSADAPSYEQACETLGISADASEEEAKRAYRRLMSRHHPDKLAAKGLPEEMMRAATERTRQIKAAWEAVKAARAA